MGENHLKKEGGQTVLEKISQAANRKFLLSPDAYSITDSERSLAEERQLKTKGTADIV